MCPTVTCTSCVIQNIQKKKTRLIQRTSKCFIPKLWSVKLLAHKKLKYEQHATHSTQIKFEKLSSACSSKSFSHTNSDFYSQAHCAVQRWLPCLAMMTQFSCVLRISMQNLCVFFNKENKPKKIFLEWYVIFPKADTSTNIIIQKRGIYTNRSQGKAINVFGYD